MGCSVVLDLKVDKLLERKLDLHFCQQMRTVCSSDACHHICTGNPQMLGAHIGLVITAINDPFVIDNCLGFYTCKLLKTLGELLITKMGFSILLQVTVAFPLASVWETVC